MATLVRSKDWSLTPLGPTDRWSRSLRTMVDMVLSQPFPTILLWGPDLVQIYNDGYRVIAGGKHPLALGQPTYVCWSEIADVTRPIYDQVLRGESVKVHDRPMTLLRNGAPEETFFTVAYSPARDDDGSIAGVLCIAFETTAQVIGQRERDRLLHQLETERTQLANIFQKSPTFSALLRGPEHVFVMANDSYYQTAGHRELLGKTVREALPDLEGQGYFELLDRVYTTGEPFRSGDLPVMIQREPGREMEQRFVEVLYEPIRDSDGAVSGIVVHGLDLTARKQVEAALQESEERFRGAFEQSIIGIAMTDLDGVILRPNSAFCALVGRTPEELIGQDSRAFTHPEDVDRNVDILGRLKAQSTRSSVYEKRYVRKDGTIVHVQVSLSPTHDSRGAPVNLMAVVEDISERKQAQAALAGLAEQRRLALDAAQMGWWQFDVSTGVVVLDERAMAIFDLEGSNIGYPDVIARMHPDDQKLVDAAVGASIDPADPKPYSIEYRLLLPDGTVRWVHARGQAHFTGKGETRRTVSLVGTIADVTEAKLSHDALRESEARLQQLADAMPQMVFAATPDGHVDYFNRQWYEYTGLPEGEAGYESWRQVHTEEGLQRAMRDWPEAVRTGNNYQIEYRLRSRDGEYRWHLGRAVPVRDEAGKIVRWFGTNTDIHDQKMAEESIRHSREQMAMVVKGANVGVWYCPLPFGRLIWDEKIKEHFHLPPDADVTMQVFCDRLHPDDLAPTLAAIDRSIQEHTPYEVDYRTLSEDKQHTKWIRAIGRAFYDPDGTPVHFDGISVDVTERAEAERALRESEERLRLLLKEREDLLVSERAARAEAERASRLKDDFLATVSHELRTPLNAILGYAQLLRQGAVQPHKVSDGLEVIERNARIQAQIIEDILDMSRIVSGKMRLDVQRVELQSVIEAAMETVRPAADAKSIRLVRTVDPLAGPVAGDPSRLQQVVWNLLANSIKFTPKGGRIQIVLASVNSHVEVAVSDNGQGIKQEFLPYVFDKFRQADASMARKHGGLGLGLAIVKNFVELHGGSVAVKSPGEGQGSTFVVSIPISAVHASPASEDRVHPRSPSPRMRFEDRPSLTGVSVLVVDDEPDARELVRRSLEDCGAHVTTAGSAEEAIHMLNNVRVDVLVSDIGMPGEDGYTLIRRVRERGAERQGGIPAVALTAFARSEDRMRALKAGYQSHIAKPVEPVELMFAVATMVGKTGHG